MRYRIVWNDGRTANMRYSTINANSRREAAKKWRMKLKAFYKKPLSVLNKKITLLEIKRV